MKELMSLEKAIPSDVILDKTITAVSARWLAEWLETDLSHFTRWFKKATNLACLEENVDYCRLAFKGEGIKDPVNKTDLDIINKLQ